MSTQPPQVSPDVLRTRFSQAMSRMYRSEVPAYGTLVGLTAKVNAEVLAADPALRAELSATDRLDHLSEERHGAIRVGTAAELALLGRLFALFGMEPVGYYDLSVAGLPVHSTAFRPVGEAALSQNAFRVFTSLLRLDLLEDAALRAEAEALLADRDIFTSGARTLIERAEREGGVADAEVDAFICEAVQTFRWHQSARAEERLYQRLNQVHSLVADVVCFQGPHINHLTPRTLDIDAMQARMPLHGMHPKDTIEGPPRRTCPILLRQTSFKAIEEPIRFPDGTGGWTDGRHRARFGEVEQRGIALTEKGRALYDRLLDESRMQQQACPDVARRAGIPAEVFAAFPDDWTALREQELGWFEYALTPAGRAAARDGAAVATLADLLARGYAIAHPIIYEDFLPVSAAGIFRSNLGADAGGRFARSPNRAAFEAALGRPVLDECSLYAQQQAMSVAECLAAFARPAAKVRSA